MLDLFAPKMLGEAGSTLSRARFSFPKIRLTLLKVLFISYRLACSTKAKGRKVPPTCKALSLVKFV